jgi:hypothetical protein
MVTFDGKWAKVPIKRNGSVPVNSEKGRTGGLPIHSSIEFVGSVSCEVGNCWRYAVNKY